MSYQKTSRTYRIKLILQCGMQKACVSRTIIANVLTVSKFTVVSGD